MTNSGSIIFDPTDGILSSGSNIMDAELIILFESLEEVLLIFFVNMIPHQLARNLQNRFLVRNSYASFYQVLID